MNTIAKLKSLVNVDVNTFRDSDNSVEPVVEEYVEEPVVEESIVEKPIVEKPVVEKPIVGKPVIEKPVVETIETLKEKDELKRVFRAIGEPEEEEIYEDESEGTYIDEEGCELSQEQIQELKSKIYENISMIKRDNALDVADLSEIRDIEKYYSKMSLEELRTIEKITENHVREKNKQRICEQGYWSLLELVESLAKPLSKNRINLDGLTKVQKNNSLVVSTVKRLHKDKYLKDILDTVEDNPLLLLCTLTVATGVAVNRMNQAIEKGNEPVNSKILNDPELTNNLKSDENVDRELENLLK